MTMSELIEVNPEFAVSSGANVARVRLLLITRFDRVFMRDRRGSEFDTAGKLGEDMRAIQDAAALCSSRPWARKHIDERTRQRSADECRRLAADLRRAIDRTPRGVPVMMSMPSGFAIHLQVVLESAADALEGMRNV